MNTIQEREEIKRKFDEMWNAGQFHWNENKKSEINPQRIWNVFIEPMLTQNTADTLARVREKLDWRNRKDIPTFYDGQDIVDWYDEQIASLTPPPLESNKKE